MSDANNVLKPVKELNVGDIGVNGNKIKFILLQSVEMIVYMDESESICWETEKGYQFVQGFSEIQNKISHLEAVADNLFSKKEAYQIKCLLAEGYLRALDNKDLNAAREAIANSEARITKNGSEILKQEYAKAALIGTFICLISVFTMRYFKEIIIYNYSSNVYEILQTMAFGGIGSYIFATIRLKNYSPEIVLTKSIHRLDGLLRVFYGIIAGLVIAIGIKSNIVFGFLNGIDKTIYITVFLGLIAGASEVLIPNLIKQVEAKAGEEKEENK